MNTLPSLPFPMSPLAPVDLRVGTVSPIVFLGSHLNNTFAQNMNSWNSLPFIAFIPFPWM